MKGGFKKIDLDEQEPARLLLRQFALGANR